MFLVIVIFNIIILWLGNILEDILFYFSLIESCTLITELSVTHNLSYIVDNLSNLYILHIEDLNFIIIITFILINNIINDINGQETELFISSNNTPNTFKNILNSEILFLDFEVLKSLSLFYNNFYLESEFKFRYDLISFIFQLLKILNLYFYLQDIRKLYLFKFSDNLYSTYIYISIIIFFLIYL